MGRSVSSATGSAHIAFSHIEPCDDEDVAREDWERYCDGFKEAMQKAFPSLSGYDAWVGREDHVLLANNYAQFGVSEYCGFVSMWVVPIEERLLEDSPGFKGLRDRWIAQIEERFYQVAAKCFGSDPLQLQGYASNGMAVFQRA